MKVGLLALVTSFLVALALPAIAGQPDADGDSVADKDDNCLHVANGAQTDGDGDSVGDACDNCVSRTDATQCDTNSDGYGNSCDGDYNNDGVVGFPDLGGFWAPNFGAPSPNLDADGGSVVICDGVVGFPDLGGTWAPGFGGPPGVSGKGCAHIPGNTGECAPSCGITQPITDAGGDAC